MSKSKLRAQQFRNTTLYSIDVTVEESLKTQWPQISEILAKRHTAGQKRLACPVSTNALFIKTSTVNSLPARIRTTLGVKRRSGMYDWSLEELRNHIEAQKRTTLAPRLLGYGLVRKGRGLVTEVFLNYEHLAQWLDGISWLQQAPSRAQAFVESTLDLIMQLNHAGIYHLDLWAANVMIQENDLKRLKAIDLENCYIGPNQYVSETLGFQFAFLYRYQLHAFISESHYDQLVNAKLAQQPHVDQDRFRPFYECFKHQDADRKERHLIPKRGKLKLFSQES